MIAAMDACLLVAWMETGCDGRMVGVSPARCAWSRATTPKAIAAPVAGHRGHWTRGVVLQARSLHTALSIFRDHNAKPQALGIPHDPTGTFNLFTSLTAVGGMKIPCLMALRYRRRAAHTGE